MSNDLTQISVMVPDDSKQEWKETASDSEEYNSMSQLIRTAVGKEISGKYDGQGIGKGELQEVLDERIVDNLETVKRTLSHVDQQVGQIQDTTEQQSSIGRFTRIEVFSAVPKGEEKALTLPEITERLGEPFTPSKLSIIIDEFDEIKSVESDDTMKFYREE